MSQRSFDHTIFLTGVHADSVARIKLALWMGVAAYFACGWCLFHGTRSIGAGGGSSMCFKGYSKPEPQPQGSSPAAAVQIGTGTKPVLGQGIFSDTC